MCRAVPVSAGDVGAGVEADDGDVGVERLGDRGRERVGFDQGGGDHGGVVGDAVADRGGLVSGDRVRAEVEADAELRGGGGADFRGEAPEEVAFFFLRDHVSAVRDLAERGVAGGGVLVDQLDPVDPGQPLSGRFLDLEAEQRGLDTGREHRGGRRVGEAGGERFAQRAVVGRIEVLDLAGVGLLGALAERADAGIVGVVDAEQGADLFVGVILGEVFVEDHADLAAGLMEILSVGGGRLLGSRLDRDDDLGTVVGGAGFGVGREEASLGGVQILPGAVGVLLLDADFDPAVVVADQGGADGDVAVVRGQDRAEGGGADQDSQSEHDERTHIEPFRHCEVRRRARRICSVYVELSVGGQTVVGEGGRVPPPSLRDTSP